MMKLVDLSCRWPDGTLPQRLNAPRDLRAFYRLMNCDELTYEAILSAHRDFVLKKIAQTKSTVLIISDATEQAVAPASLEQSLVAGVDIELERQQLNDHWQQRLARSRYEVEQVRRQYNAVDPDHGLVARELDGRWDESMRANERLQVEYAKFAKDCPKQLLSEEREQILALSNDLPALWRAATQHHSGRSLTNKRMEAA